MTPKLTQFLQSGPDRNFFMEFDPDCAAFRLVLSAGELAIERYHLPGLTYAIGFEIERMIQSIETRIAELGTERPLSDAAGD